MLGTADTVRAVREALGHIGDGVPIVIDPVMVAESGAVLLDDAARAAPVAELLPLATVITPNLPEARVLAAEAGDGRAPDDVEELARALHALGPADVVVTGGHRDEITDVFFDGTTVALLRGDRHPDGAAHGSGCTHSSALAAHLALGFKPARGGGGARADRVGSGPRRPSLDRPGTGPVNVLGRRRLRA